MYRSDKGEAVCTTLNQALFTRLYLDSRKSPIGPCTLPFDVLHGAYLLYREHQSRPRSYQRVGGLLHPESHRAPVPMSSTSRLPR